MLHSRHQSISRYNISLPVLLLLCLRKTSTQALPNAFELFGADLLVSHNPSAEDKFSVSILELNSEPAIELTGARLSWILESMFSGICQACISPFFHDDSAEVTEAHWEVGETRHGLYKSLHVQVRGSRGW